MIGQESSRQLEQELGERLLPGERVLWVGRNKVWFGRRDLFGTVIDVVSGVIVLAAFSYFAILPYLNEKFGAVWTWLGLVGMVLGLSNLFSAWFGGRLGSRSQRVFLTDRRFGVRGRVPLAFMQDRVMTMPVETISRLDAKVSQGSSGDLVFSGKWRSWPSNACTIYDVDNVEDLARKLARAAGIKPRIEKVAG